MTDLKSQVYVRIPGYTYVGVIDKENSDSKFLKLTEAYTLGELEHIEVTDEMLLPEKYVPAGLYVNKAFISEAALLRTRDSVLHEILS